jgi:hypothetical protein
MNLFIFTYKYIFIYLNIEKFDKLNKKLMVRNYDILFSVLLKISSRRIGRKEFLIEFINGGDFIDFGFIKM